jgi:hypothetical protein
MPLFSCHKPKESSEAALKIKNRRSFFLPGTMLKREDSATDLFKAIEERIQAARPPTPSSYDRSPRHGLNENQIDTESTSNSEQVEFFTTQRCASFSLS